MLIKFVARSLTCLALTSVSMLSAAQQTPPVQTEPNAPAPAASTSQEAPKSASPAQDTSKPGSASPTGTSDQGKVEGTSKDRLFFALPNFLTLENADQVPPLTTKQKYSVVARSSFDYVQYPWYGFLAGISQAQNSEPGYGQGAAGYGKRFGAAIADGTIENFLTSAVLPSLLHQDPRYFQLGKGGFFHRAGYSVSRIVVTRGDSGKSQFNFSEDFGSAISAAISTYSYHPRSFTTVRLSPSGTPTLVHNPSDRTLKNTASVWGTQVAYDTITIVVKEFWPDVHRKLSHKHSKDDAGAVGGSRP